MPLILESDKVVFSANNAIIERQKAQSKTIRGVLAEEDSKIVAHAHYSGDIVDVTRLKSGSDFLVTVHPASDRAQGWFSSPVSLNVSGPHDEPRGTVRFLIQGEVIPAFRFSPRLIALGALPLGTKVRQCILVDCKLGKLLDSSPLAAHYDVRVERIDDRQSGAIVTFVVKEIGAHEDLVHLIYESDEGEISTTNVPITYYGYSFKDANSNGTP